MFCPAGESRKGQSNFDSGTTNSNFEAGLSFEITDGGEVKPKTSVNIPNVANNGKWLFNDKSGTDINNLSSLVSDGANINWLGLTITPGQASSGYVSKKKYKSCD